MSSIKIIGLGIAFLLGASMAFGAEKVTKPTNPTVPAQTERKTSSKKPDKPAEKPERKPQSKPTNNTQSQNKNRPKEIEENGITYLLNWNNYTAEVSKADQNITNANIPASITVSGKNFRVTSIGDRAFSGCESLTSINIPNSVKSIGISAFWQCESLTSINIPNSITSIEETTFAYCTNLKSVTLPGSITSIGLMSFYDCQNLKSITIPNSVTSIGEQAFHNCSSLTSITIPNSVASIGYEAFSYCENLVSINIDPLNNNYVSVSGVVYSKDMKLILACPAGKKGEFIIPNSVTSIEPYAFQGCKFLTSVIIPNNITSIGKGAFWQCESLSTITIPNSVTAIEDEAFGYCESLMAVKCNANKPPVLGRSVYVGIPSQSTLYVPKGTKSAYQNAKGWKDFKTIIDNL